MDADVIFAYTADTQNLFRGALRKKTVVFSPLSLLELPASRAPRTWLGPPKFLYAGRLLYWKGVHVAVQAFAEVSRQMSGARFTIVGDGPERSKLEEAVRLHNVQGQVVFIPRLPQNKLFDLYDSHDLLLFPSFHDSGGFVVLEALSHGLPVVCLDLGGPRDIVTSNSGVVIKTYGRNTTQVATAMADEICRLLSSPRKLSELSDGAIARAQEFILATRVAEFYDRAMRFIVQNDKPIGDRRRRHRINYAGIRGIFGGDQK
jgi:glycosyltransferase involved in cell wall biosynthesis